jgi:hypothetical protein
MDKESIGIAVENQRKASGCLDEIILEYLHGDDYWCGYHSSSVNYFDKFKHN